MSAYLNLGSVLTLMTAFLGTVSAQEIKCPIFMAEPSCGEHEIGLNMFNWTNMSSDQGSWAPTFGYANGLLYKLHCHRNVFRAAVDVRKGTYERGAKQIDSPGYGGHYSAGDRSVTEVRVGYERRLSRTKLQPFVGADIGYRHQVDDGVYEGWGDFVYNPYSGTERIVARTIFMAGAIGLNYRPVEHWSFTAEVYGSFGWVRSRRERLERSWLMPDEHQYILNSQMGDPRFDPIRTLAVSYHF